MGQLLSFIAMAEFPNRINELRRAAGLTQETLGEMLGTSKMNVSRYETGKQNLTRDIAALRQTGRTICGASRKALSHSNNSLETLTRRKWIC